MNKPGKVNAPHVSSIVIPGFYSNLLMTRVGKGEAMLDPEAYKSGTVGTAHLSSIVVRGFGGRCPPDWTVGQSHQCHSPGPKRILTLDTLDRCRKSH